MNEVQQFLPTMLPYNNKVSNRWTVVVGEVLSLAVSSRRLTPGARAAGGQHRDPTGRDQAEEPHPPPFIYARHPAPVECTCHRPGVTELWKIKQLTPHKKSFPPKLGANVVNSVRGVD